MSEGNRPGSEARKQTWTVILDGSNRRKILGVFKIQADSEGMYVPVDVANRFPGDCLFLFVESSESSTEEDIRTGVAMQIAMAAELMNSPATADWYGQHPRFTKFSLRFPMRTHAYLASPNRFALSIYLRLSDFTFHPDLTDLCSRHFGSLTGVVSRLVYGLQLREA